ncbi:MAG: ATP-binding protein, partial [Thermoleophilaceae bacterium]
LRFQAQLLDQVDAAVVATDLDGTITHWNRGASELLGWWPEDTCGLPIVELPLLGPRARAGMPDVLRRLGRGDSWDQELRLSRRDGSRFHAHVSASPVRDETGAMLGLVAVAVDVSDRKRVAGELARRAEQQAAVAELGRLAITGTGVDELMRQALDALERILDAEHPSVMELLPGGREVMLRAGALRDRSLVGDLRLPVTADGMHGYVLARDEPVVAPNLERETRFRPPPQLLARGARSSLSTVIEGKDGPFGLLGVHADKVRTYSQDDVNFVRAVANVLGAAITREREEQLEQQLQRARRLESVGQLAGGVAHDFNNLLAVILNFSHFALEAAEEGSTLRDDLQEIKRAAERAAELTRQLLVFSRREPVETLAVDVGDALAGIEAMLRRTIGEHIQLRTERGAGVRSVRMGRGQLEQVLVNLAVNARDAMAQGGRLTIRAERAERVPAELPAGDWVLVTVEDTGTGMLPDVASHAFDPFFTTKPKGQGTGLGMASVYGIVSQAKGDVRIDSRVDEGTTVSIWLPAGEDPLSSEAPEPAQAPDGTGESILVVEDEDQVRALTSRILSEHGYAVTEAPDGESALEAWATSSEAIDLLVTDVVMPGMSGAELAERLLAARPELKVLYMSGYTADALERHGPPDRGVAVLEKPFSAERLLRRVREALEIESRAWT